MSWDVGDLELKSSLGGGNLSYRFGGGTDLIGDTAIPVDFMGPVFSVATSPNLDVGFSSCRSRSAR